MDLHESKWFQRAKDHRFSFFLNLGLAAFIVYSTAHLEAFIAYFLILFFPGYLIARIFLKEDWERTLVALPFSLMGVGLVTYVHSWFTLQVIEWSSVVFTYLIILAFTFWAKKRFVMDRFPLGKLTVSPTHVFGILILLSMVGFWVQGATIYGYDQPLPYGATSWDKMVHFAWVDGMMSSGSIELPSSLHGGDRGVESVYFTPLSIQLYGLFSRFSGLTFWNAHDVMSGLIFALSILLVFMLVNYFWDTRTGLVAAFIASLPTGAFFFANLGGMYRIGMSLVLLAALIVVLEWCFHQRPGINYLLGVLMGAMLILHPIDLVLLIPFFAYGLYRLWKDRSFIGYFLPAIVISLLLFIPFAVVSPSVFSSQYFFDDWELISSDTFEQRSTDLVGPVLKVGNYLIYLILALIGIALLLWKKIRTKEETHSVPWRWIAVVIGSLLLTAGFHTILFHYSGKMRAIVYLLMIIPFVAYFFVWLFDRLPKLDGRIKWVAFVALIILMHPPWGYLEATYQTKVDAPTWDAIQWVRTNTDESDTVYAIYGFYQHSHILTNRAGNYAGQNTKVIDYFMGKDETFPLYCVPGYRSTGILQWETAPCPTSPSKLEEYDYLLVDLVAAPQHPRFAGDLEAKLATWGFLPVYRVGDITVYGK